MRLQPIPLSCQILDQNGLCRNLLGQLLLLPFEGLVLAHHQVMGVLQRTQLCRQLLVLLEQPVVILLEGLFVIRPQYSHSLVNLGK